MSDVDSDHVPAEQRALSPQGIDQLLVDLGRIRALVVECLASPPDCKEALIGRQIREVSLPLCRLSLARVVEVLNSSAPYQDYQGETLSNQGLQAYVEVLDDVTCYIESIRDGYQCDDDFLENIEDKMSDAGVRPESSATPSLENFPADVMKDFLDSVHASLREIRLLLAQWQQVPEQKPLAMELLRHLHALKGGVLVYGVEGLVDNIQYLESYVAAFLKGELKTSRTLFELLERYVSRLDVIAKLLARQQVENLLSFTAEGVEPVSRSPARPLQRGSGLWLEGGDGGEVVRQPFSQKLPRLRFLVERASVMLDKQVRLIVRGEALEMPVEVLGKLIAPLELLLWNAIDHGIESLARRRAMGKADCGEIVLSFGLNEQDSMAVITVADDGAGIDEVAVRQKALDSGCVTSAEAAAQAALSEMIFYPGLSTSPSISPVSGRGMGLDVVNIEVGRLGGEVQVASIAGRGASFTLFVPL